MKAIKVDYWKAQYTDGKKFKNNRSGYNIYYGSTCIGFFVATADYSRFELHPQIKMQYFTISEIQQLALLLQLCKNELKNLTP